MSNNRDFNLEFRPIYFGPEGLEKHYGSRINGELRRKTAMHIASCAEFDEDVMAASLESSHREAVGAVHPWFMGGEYLPGFFKGEIEIARIILASTTMDITSIRAQKIESGFEFRIVDEYETEFDFAPKKAGQALSMKELIGIINECELVTGPWEMNLEGGLIPDKIYNFATVTSVFYPELEAFFLKANESWLEKKKLEEWEEEERSERDALLQAEHRKKVIAPYRERINRYILRFSKDPLRYPGGGSYGSKRGWAIRFIEEYLSKNGCLPSENLQIKVRGYSGSYHDFSDL
jgi:hypothetical protein